MDADDKDITNQDITNKSKSSVIKSDEPKYKNSIIFIFDDPSITIYPDDNVIEFKKKIYISLNIPIFRQHIWYSYQKQIVPLSYSVFNNNIPKDINAQEMLNKYNDSKQTDMIENIPISNDMYQSKDNIKIIANDSFTLIGNYYYKYGITEYNLLDLNEFIQPTRDKLNKIILDRYQLELIYYSFIAMYWPMLSITAFSEYIKSDCNIPKYYPDMHQPIQELAQIYNLEKKIMDTRYDLLNNTKNKSEFESIRKLLSIGIVSYAISITSFKNNTDTVLYIRNLFDKFELTDTIISSKCYLRHGDKNIILNKAYKKHPFIKEHIAINSIMFRIKNNTNSVKYINLTLYPNGNYLISSKHHGFDYNDFNSVFNETQTFMHSIIEKINLLGDYVLLTNKTIPYMTKENSVFCNTDVNIFYNKAFNENQFTRIKSIISDYNKSNIITIKNTENSGLEFYFNKGMYSFNSSIIERNIHTNNQYEFLSDGIIKQKWNNLIDKVRLTKMYNRISDVKIEITGIKETEFYSFFNLIITLFYIYKTQTILSNNAIKPGKHDSSNKDIDDETNKQLQKIKLKKKLRNLKDQDPVLYNFKQMYKTENIYSRICQKPSQPILLNSDDFNKLTNDEKKKAIKYWNFTTNKDAYYTCPNPKYPYIKFIIKKHPNDYCIPCCKKKQIESSIIDAKKMIYNICMKDHVYKPLDRTITLKSRYIMSYGKDVEEGRLSRLPEDSLEPLLYETFSINNSGMDQECMTDVGYYLYGISQEINNIKNVAILNIILLSTEHTLIDFINEIIKILNEHPNKFKVMLNGKISKYFINVGHFTTVLRDTFLSHHELTDEALELPWNDIFVNVALLLFNINFIQFSHKKKDDIKLIIPSNITTKEQFLVPNLRHIIILKKRTNIFPIYLLNTEVFFKTKLFTKQIFNYDDPCIFIISTVVDTYLSTQAKKHNIYNATFDNIIKFIKGTEYSITKIFVNNSNFCYYIQITTKAKKFIHVPIELVAYSDIYKLTLTYDVFLRSKNKTELHSLMQFMADYNKWANTLINTALGIVDKKIYQYINITNWLVLSSVYNQVKSSSNVIGFVCNNINYYINDISLENALKIKNVKIMQLFYDPDIINLQITQNTRITHDDRHKKIGRSIYNAYLYQIVLLEFITLFNTDRNGQLRDKLKKTILINITNIDKTLNEIYKLGFSDTDNNKIKNILYDYNVSRIKNNLFSDINTTTFNFDMYKFEKLKTLEPKEIYNELEKMSHKFIKYGDINKIKNFEFPNIYTSCQSKNKKNMAVYCNDKHLIIDKTKFHNILKILTSDILNPIKEKWLFNTIFSNSIISFFKFIRRPDETIKIEIVD